MSRSLERVPPHPVWHIYTRRGNQEGFITQVVMEQRLKMKDNLAVREVGQGGEGSWRNGRKNGTLKDQGEQEDGTSESRTKY